MLLQAYPTSPAPFKFAQHSPQYPSLSFGARYLWLNYPYPFPVCSVRVSYAVLSSAPISYFVCQWLLFTSWQLDSCFDNRFDMFPMSMCPTFTTAFLCSSPKDVSEIAHFHEKYLDWYCVMNVYLLICACLLVYFFFEVVFGYFCLYLVNLYCAILRSWDDSNACIYLLPATHTGLIIICPRSHLLSHDLFEELQLGESLHEIPHWQLPSTCFHV